MGAWPKFHRSAFKFKKHKYFLPFTASSSWRGNNIEFCKDRTIGIMIILKRTLFSKTLCPVFMDRVQRSQREPLQGYKTFNLQAP